MDLIRAPWISSFQSPLSYSRRCVANLDTTLRAHRINNLLIVGVNTNVCVESTLRDAYHKEYFAMMVADATFQSGPSAMMDATIFNIEKFFGWVSTVDEICRALPPR